MRKDFGAKTWLYPMPVMILAAYDAGGVPMAMNAGWVGVVADDTVAIGLGSHHKTTAHILQSRAFTLSPATAEQLTACDYVGVESGNQTADKMERSGFHTRKAGCVNAPLIDELPLALECEVVRYDEQAQLLLGRVVNVSAEECILGENGRIDADKAGFLTLDPSSLRYRTVGPVVGQAFHDGLALSRKTQARPFDDRKE